MSAVAAATQPVAPPLDNGAVTGRPAKHLRKLRLVDELARPLALLEEALEALARRARTKVSRVEELDRAVSRLYGAIFVKVGEGPGLVDRILRLEELLEGGVRVGEGVIDRLLRIEAELEKGGPR